MELKRKNINRGFTRLRVWEDALILFDYLYNITKEYPYELTKSRNNTLDSSHSIMRNIAEGYCRKNLKEYLNFLNIALGSCGELFSSMISFHKIKIINEEAFENFDELHYKVENELISLIKALQEKQREGDWDDSFIN